MGMLILNIVVLILGVCAIFYLLMKAKRMFKSVKRWNEAYQTINQVENYWHLLDSRNPSNEEVSLDKLLMLGKCLNVMESLCNEFSVNLKLHLALAEKFHRFGELCLAHNLLEDSLDAHMSAFFIRNKMSKKHTNESNLKLLLILSHLKISHTFKDLGDLSMAQFSYQAALDIKSKIQVDFP